MSIVSDDTPVEDAVEASDLFSDEEFAEIDADLEESDAPLSSVVSQSDAKDVVEEKEEIATEQESEELAVDDTDEGDASETEEETPQKLTATDVVGLSWDEISELETNGAEFDDGAAKLYKSMKKTVNQKFEENATIRKELEEQRRMAAEDRRLAAEERREFRDTMLKGESDKRLAAEEASMVDMTEEQRELYQVKKELRQVQGQVQENRKSQEQQSQMQTYQNISNRTEAVVAELAKSEPAIMKKFGKRISKDAYQAVFEAGNANKPIEDIAKQVVDEWKADLSPESISELIKDEKYATIRNAETKTAAKKLIKKNKNKKKSTTMAATRSGEPPKKKERVKEIVGDKISDDLQDELNAIVDEVEKHGGIQQ